jgi:hypothetical protein
LGWTRNSSNPVELIFGVFRAGTGQMIVAPDVGVTIQDPDDIAATYRLQYQSVVTYRTYGDDLWVVE